MSVAFAVNCFERTYRDVLSAAYVERLHDEQAGGFDRLHLLVSNVADRDDAKARAEALGAGVNVLWVDEHLDDALRVTGLSRRALAPMLWYSAAPLVAVTACAERWLAYWDADVRLDEPHDWITPSVAKLEGDAGLLVANPRWRVPGQRDTLDAETIRYAPPFAVGRGFSDQAFLVERERLARRVYRRFSRAALRYPTAEHAAIFEQRVDAHMQREGLLRATYLDATYTHPAAAGGYPATWWTPLRRKVVRGLRRF